MPKKPIQKVELKSHDPDSWLLHLRTPDAIKKWLATEKDYISDYMVNICSAEAKGPHGVAEQVKRMGELIELIPDDTLRSAYFNEVKETWPAFRKNYKMKKREAAAPLPKLDKLSKDTKSEYFDYGFFPEGDAYYTMGREGKIRICNFTIEILYFVHHDNEPKYVCILKHMFGRQRICAISTDDFVSVGTFRKVIARLGAYVFEGTDVHLNKIKLKLFYGVREAKEPKYMGFSSSGGFYTWANGLFHNGEFYPTDKYGMVHLEHRIESMEEFNALPPECHVKFGEDLHVLENPEKFIEKNGEDVVAQYIESGKANRLSFYFLPFSTTLKLSADDDDDDNYEFERRFKHKPKGDKLAFEKWAQLMVDVYKENGVVAVAYYCMALFRDIVFKYNNSYIPMLGFFGPRQSGKSTCARSLNKMFGEGLEDGVNLESGSTATGVRRYLASMQNAILWLNEYKNTLPEATLGMIKGIADGSGKLTGRNTGGNETKTYKPRCAVVVCGQDLPTKDPAIFSRMINCEFDGKERNYEAYQQLTDLEKNLACTSVTLEVLNYREDVKKYYAKIEPESAAIFRDGIRQLAKEAEDRIVLNNSSIVTVCSILSQCGLKFPFTQEDLIQILLFKIDVQINIQQTSDDVEQYFSVVQRLIDTHQVREMEHYKITKDSSGKRKLFLRVRGIHSSYLVAANQAGMAAMTEGTAMSYLKKHRSFLDYKKDGVSFEKFGSGRSSAYVFDYDILVDQGIELKGTETVEF